jgi:hypothetical protein
VGIGEKRTLAILGAAAAVATAVFAGMAWSQTNQAQDKANTLQEAALDSHLEEVMMGLDRHFVRYPRLRPYFYSAKGRFQPYPRPGLIRNQAFATAELVIDFADDVGAYKRKREMTPAAGRRWSDIVQAYFRESRVTRVVWSRYAGSYDRATACVLGAPIGDELDNWNPRTNSPPATGRACGG